MSRDDTCSPSRPVGLPSDVSTMDASDPQRQTVASGIETPEYPVPVMRNIVPRRPGSSLLSAEPTYMSRKPGPPNVTVVTRLAGTRI